MMQRLFPFSQPVSDSSLAEEPNLRYLQSIMKEANEILDRYQPGRSTTEGNLQQPDSPKEKKHGRDETMVVLDEVLQHLLRVGHIMEAMQRMVEGVREIGRAHV